MVVVEFCLKRNIISLSWNVNNRYGMFFLKRYPADFVLVLKLLKWMELISVKIIFLTAWVGSIGLAMVWFASLLAGYLCDHFGCRITCFMGGLLCIAGLVATSFANSLTLMYFTYSLVYGLGACFIFNSYYLAVGKYFDKKLSVAVGITALGSSVGVLYTGPLLQALLDAFGWRNTFRIMTATFALVCILSLNFNPYVVKMTSLVDVELETLEQQVGTKGRISFYCSVWTYPVYTFVVISVSVASFGMFIPQLNLVSI